MSLTGSTSTIRLADGTLAFQKALAGAPEDFFTFEAAGLRMLKTLGARVPEVYDVTADHLVMELVEVSPTAPQRPHPETALGKDLARLHLAGLEANTGAQHFGGLEGLSHWYLGAAPVDLKPASTLYESLVVNRIQPLTQRAVSAGLLDSVAVELAEQLAPGHLGPAEPATIVHGDLWAGNRMVDTAGASWLIDPSCHWGHREQDIAMMHLFGGFSADVVRQYQRIFPLAPGWQDRIPVYQLVPLLVHVLLFGSAYANPTLKALLRTVNRNVRYE